MHDAPTSRIDFANVDHKDHWLSHPVFGDPSFDAFERHSRNPICRGVAGLEWPVNGFLFQDPVSGHWYLYVGHYPKGYAGGPDKANSICTVFRSKDAGRTWESLGPVFEPTPFYFRGDSSPVGNAPDVSVVHADGRYHMAYDWTFAGSVDCRSRQTGVGYAWSDKPEGPFHRFHEPIIRNDVPAKNPILGKYNRLYASTLIRRAHDWLLLTLMDSGPYFAWGLAGMVADRPEGPYGNLTPLFHVEGTGYQPPLMEYFPAFVHDGWVYAPSTSVALNRDFQMIQRAQMEKAMQPDAWHLFRHGSLWHGVDQEHETAGIWGQTFSGFVDGQNRLQIMFPSKDADNMGTINLASRAWDRPYSASGFGISGHQGPSLALLKLFFEDFVLESEFDLAGTACFFWANTAPLGPNAPTSDATLHPLSWPKGSGLRLNRNGWELVNRTDDQQLRVLAAGPLPEAAKRILRIQRRKDGGISLTLDGQNLWCGMRETGAGCIGVVVEKNSYLVVKRFVVEGIARPATLSLLYTEALLGAGQNRSDWQEIASSLFRYGAGAVSRTEGGRGKWNFAGSGMTLWAPKGPDYGRVEVIVDNQRARTIDLGAETPRPSQPVLSVTDLPNGFHAVTLHGINGKLIIDSLDICCPIPCEKAI